MEVPFNFNCLSSILTFVCAYVAVQWGVSCRDAGLHYHLLTVIQIVCIFYFMVTLMSPCQKNALNGGTTPVLFSSGVRNGSVRLDLYF